MNVNRIFCYSIEIAKKNGNKLPILELFLTLIVFFVSIIVLDNALLSVFITTAFMALIMYFCIILGLRLRNRMTGFATTEDGRIFKAIALNKGQGLYLGGVAVGSLVDQLADSSKNIGETLGGAVGATAQIYSMNKSAQYMSHPEIIAKMVESAPNITGAEVLEILKIHNIVENRKSYKVICDYKFLRTGKVKYNKKISIEKSYNMVEQLIQTLNSKKLALTDTLGKIQTK